MVKQLVGEELSEGSYFYKVKTEKAGKEETKQWAYHPVQGKQNPTRTNRPLRP